MWLFWKMGLAIKLPWFVFTTHLKMERRPRFPRIRL
jgi:hypothetical protein